MKNKKSLLKILIFILLIVSTMLGFYNYFKTQHNAEWTCIAQQCTAYIEGDAWADKYCLFEEGEMMCNVLYEGQQIKIPVENIDIDAMKECSEYKCVSKVLIKNV